MKLCKTLRAFVHVSGDRVNKQYGTRTSQPPQDRHNSVSGPFLYTQIASQPCVVHPNTLVHFDETYLYALTLSRFRG